MKTQVIIQVYSDNDELLSETTQEMIKRHEELSCPTSTGLTIEDDQQVNQALEKAYLEARMKCTFFRGSCGHEAVQREGTRARQVKTVNGDLTVRLSQGQCTRCGGYAAQGGEFLPAHGNMSPELEKITLELVPLMVSFAALSEVWKKTRGLELSHAEIERIVLYRGQQLRTLQQEAYEQEPEPLLQEPPERLYISCDGTFCHAVEPGQKKLEGRLGMVFTDQRAEVSKGRFELLEKRYCASFLGKDDLGEQLEREALAFRMEDAKEVSFVADGERALWDVKAERFPQARGMLDWNHVSRKLTQALGAIESPAARQKTADQLRTLLWEGKAVEALQQLRCLHTRWAQEALSERRAKQVKQLAEYIGYLEANRPWLIHYAQAQQEGYFVGSSIMESAINHLLATRLKKKRSRRWLREGADSVARIITTIEKANGSRRGRNSVKEPPDSPCGFVIRPEGQAVVEDAVAGPGAAA